MVRSTLRSLALCAALLVLAACGNEQGSPSQSDFRGDWVVISNAAQKQPCEITALERLLLHELHIDQDGSTVLVDYDGVVMNGNVQDQLLLATGTGNDGEAWAIELTSVGGALIGELQISSGCSELRAISASRRATDAELSGHWEFDLTVVGEGGCAHISDYSDCFRIFQDGSDLLVVDDVGGNLTGMVIGGFARIERNTAEEQTILVFRYDSATQTMSGDAIRAFSEQACSSDLEFFGRPTDLPCALHGI